MQIYLEVIFWVLLYLTLHTYAIYPLSIWLFSSLKKVNLESGTADLPFISILIAVHNEENIIGERLENLSKQKYEFNKVEVIVGSDACSDKTNSILQELTKKYNWLRSVEFKTRRGKAAVLNDLVKISNSEVLIFTDANTMFDENALQNLVKYFHLPKVGGVCGRLILEEPNIDFDKSNLEKSYWNYETYIKKFEGKLGVLISANGGIFAIKKKLFKPFPENIPITDDLFITLSVLEQRYKFCYAFKAAAYEQVANEIKAEFNRKVRFAATNFETLKRFLKVMFSNNLLLSYSFWSHKILRWFMPVFLIIAFILNILLLPANNIYLLTFIVQMVLYTSAFVGFLFSKKRMRLPIITLLFFFVLTNFALLVGFWKFLAKTHSSTWQPTPRGKS